MKYTFTASQKLLSSDYDRLFKEGRSFVTKAFVFIYRICPESSDSYLGLALTKKKLKLASQRNLAKRFNREHFRVRRFDAAPCKVIVLATSHTQGMGPLKWHHAIDAFWNHLAESYPPSVSA